MGRVSTGSYDPTCRRGIHGIRWRDPATGRRREVSLRTADPEEAKRLAPQVYAEQVLGVVKEGASNFIVSPSTRFVELVAKWIDAILSELGEDTDKTYITYGKHWKKHFTLLGDVKSATIGNYQRARLKEVLRSTVQLELSAMRSFFIWLREQEYIRTVPDFPKLGRKVMGTNYKVRRRTTPTVVFTPEQMERVIAALPTHSEKKWGGRHFPVRAWFIVARETGLRPITINKLTGRDVTVSGIHVRSKNDKNRMGRVIPWTPAAREALDGVLPENLDDKIFGRHSWEYFFFKAVLKALGPEWADRMTPYDLKHGLVTELFDSGAPETGIQFLTGTKSAIRRYSHPTRSAAEEAIKARLGGRAGDRASGDSGEQHKTSRTAKKSVKS